MVFSSEAREKIIRIAKSARPSTKHVEIKDRFLFLRHCGQRMIKVKTFSGNGCRVDNQYSQTLDDSFDLVVCTCPNCDYVTDTTPPDY